MPRRSPARDGYVVDGSGFETPPDLAWEVTPSKHGDSTAVPSYGQPVADGERLYITNRLEKGPERVMYGHVHALDAEGGNRCWTSDRLRSPSHPVVWGDLTVVTAEDDTGDAAVVTFDRRDGTRRWTREFQARGSGFVAGDYLYLALEEDSDRGTIRALAEDGSTVWSREGAFEFHVNEGPVLGTDVLYVATRDGRLHVLDRMDGSTIHTHEFQHPTERRPYVTDLVATDCTVLVVVEGVLTGLDEGGSPIWEVAGEHGSMAVDDETVYVGTDLGDRVREFRALSIATGDVRWTVRGSLETYQSPVVVGDTVLVRSEGGILGLNKTDGTTRWRTDGAMGSLAVADRTLYGTAGENLRAVR